MTSVRIDTSTHARRVLQERSGQTVDDSSPGAVFEDSVRRQRLSSTVIVSKALSPIQPDDARVAIALGTDELDRSLFASRWERASPKQKQLMAAMAVDTGPSSVADLVTRMGKKKPSDLSVFRDELIKKGLIYASERGFLDVTAPLMSDFIQRRSNEL